jgi:hypothetical protein
VAYVTELNLAAGGFDEPDHGKKGVDTGRTRDGADILGLVQRRPADIGREPDTVAVYTQNWLGEALTVVNSGVRCR